MTTSEPANLISLSDASKLGVTALVREAEGGREQFIVRDGRPVAVVMSMERFEQFQSLQEDFADLALAASRMLTSGSGRYALTDVLERFGYTREALADEPDPDRSTPEPDTPAKAQGGFPSIDPARHPLLGKWRIVGMDLWDRDYLDLVEPAYIEFDARGGGEFAFGAVQGSLDLWYAPLSIDFTWVGSDEMDEVSGAGSAELAEDGTMTGEIRFHHGDESEFTARRW